MSFIYYLLLFIYLLLLLLLLFYFFSSLITFSNFRYSIFKRFGSFLAQETLSFVMPKDRNREGTI